MFSLQDFMRRFMQSDNDCINLISHQDKQFCSKIVYLTGQDPFVRYDMMACVHILSYLLTNLVSIYACLNFGKQKSPAAVIISSSIGLPLN